VNKVQCNEVSSTEYKIQNVIDNSEINPLLLISSSLLDNDDVTESSDGPQSQSHSDKYHRNPGPTSGPGPGPGTNSGISPGPGYGPGQGPRPGSVSGGASVLSEGRDDSYREGLSRKSLSLAAIRADAMAYTEREREEDREKEREAERERNRVGETLLLYYVSSLPSWLAA
jgi:hypothetical protein